MIKTVTEAKELCNNMTNNRLNLKEADEKIRQFKEYLENATTEESKALFEEMIADLEKWKLSGDLEKREFPQGLDNIILELIEVRAFIYAIQKTPSVQLHFEKAFFYQQWLIGAAHTMMCAIGKLVSRDSRDNSLTNLWREVGPWIKSDGACTIEEAEFIDQLLDKKKGHFINENSKAFNYRNKYIAHNEHSPEINWDDLDPDIKILVRIWSLLVAWCSFGLHAPFKSEKDVYSNMTTTLDANQILDLGKYRKEYIDQVRQWSIHYLHNGEKDPGRGAFSSGVRVTVTPLKQDL